MARERLCEVAAVRAAPRVRLLDYGGTYFPARTFLPLLAKLKATYTDDPSGVADTASRLVADIRRHTSPDPSATMPSASSLDAASSLYRSRFDADHGGMRGAPKFPSSLPVRFLLRDHRHAGGAPDSLRMATVTLERMSQGGIHDQLGGGFHRYSTDDRWKVPHFEKMLYDNALLTLASLEGYQATRRKVVRGGKATAYVCERRTCELPTTDADEFARQLRKRASPAAP